MKQNSGFAAPIVIVIIAIFVLAIFVIMLQPASPIVSMETKIEPRDFKISQGATLWVQLENHDQAHAHSLEFHFVTHQLVHIYLGHDELMREESDGVIYSYSLVLQPGQKTEQPFAVKVSTLPTGIPEQTFSITIKTFVDGKSGESLQQEVRFKAEKG